MKKTFLNSVFVGITIFGTLVGAGFASGKEIWVFFAQFGPISFLIAPIVCALFFCACFLFFSFGKKFGVSSVQECMGISFKKLSGAFETILVFSNLLLLSSMFAGADSLFEIVMPNFPYRLAGVLSAIITLFVVCFGFRGIAKTNLFIVPLLVLMVLLVLGFCLKNGNLCFDFLGAKKSFNSIFFGLSFLGSNMFFSGFVFARMGKEFEKKELLLGTLFGCVLLFLSLMVMLVLLFTNKASIASDMPIVDIALMLSFPLAMFCLAVIWLGLLTTAFAMLYTISNWLKTFFGFPVLMTALASILALFLSGIGFGVFVKVVYPIMSIFGFVFMFFVGISMKSQKKSPKSAKIKVFKGSFLKNKK